MAAKLILPGFGGAYTTESWTFSAGISTGSVGTDVLDLSHCAQFMVQINSSGTGSIQIEQALAGTGGVFSSLGSSISVLTAGTVSRFDVTDGPFGVIRVNYGSISAGTGISATIVGWPIQIRA